MKIGQRLSKMSTGNTNTPYISIFGEEDRFTVRASGSCEVEQETSSSWRVQACEGQETSQGRQADWWNWQGYYQPWQEVSRQGQGYLDAASVRRAWNPLLLFST